MWGITAPELFIDTSKILLPNGTPGPIVILKVAASIKAQETADLPNVAVHDAMGFCAVVMKLDPVTVIVLLIYPAFGDALMKVGAARTVKKLAAEIMLILRGRNITVIDFPPAVVPHLMVRMTLVVSNREQEAAAVVVELPRKAVQLALTS